MNRLLRLKEVVQMVGLSRASIYRHMTWTVVTSPIPSASAPVRCAGA